MNESKFKRIIVISILTLASVLGSSEASALLQIYKVKGDVYVTSGKKSTKAERRAAVAETDILTIPDGGSVDILDSDSHRIYSSTKTGKMTIKTLIKKAESQATNITRNINRKVMAAVADNAGSKKSGYDAMGMAIHETDAVIPILVNIPQDMSYLSYLLSSPNEPDSIHQCFISLSRIPIDEDSENSDGAFNFAVSNSMRKPLFFNIVVKDDKNDVRFLLPCNPVIAPGSDNAIDQFTFLPDKETQSYVAIASESNFKIDEVRHLLDVDYIPKDNFYLTVLTMNNK